MQGIELYSKLNNPLEAIQQIGQFFAKSGMFGCDRQEQGQVLAMICLAENKSPVEITRDYDIVEGKLRKKALAALADFRSKGGKHKWLSSGDQPAANEADRYAEIELADKEQNKITYRYSMADARAEGLIRDKSRWTKRPGNMLRARCISNGLGMLCPEIFAGDDDSESEARPAPEINLTAGTEAKPSGAHTRPVVVEVQAVPVAESKVATPETPANPQRPQEPTQPLPPQPAEFKAGPSYEQPRNVATLPDELCRQVEEAIGEHAIRAVEWMRKENWLTANQGIEHLTEARAKRILKQRDSFIKAVAA